MNYNVKLKQDNSEQKQINYNKNNYKNIKDYNKK